MLNRKELLALLRQTFASPADARRWWVTPHPLLDSQVPCEVAKTASGAERVRDILVALRFGGVV